MKKFVLSIIIASALALCASFGISAATAGDNGMGAGGAVGDAVRGAGDAVNEMTDGLGDAFENDSGEYHADEFGDEDNMDGNVDDYSDKDGANEDADEVPEATTTTDRGIEKTPERVLGATDRNPSTGAGPEIFGLAAAGTIMLGTTALATRKKR